MGAVAEYAQAVCSTPEREVKVQIAMEMDNGEIGRSSAIGCSMTTPAVDERGLRYHRSRRRRSRDARPSS